MVATVRSATKADKRIRPRVKVWFDCDGQHVFCSGMCQILEAVEATGSIKDAAEKIGKSYRFVWAKIKRTERDLGQTLVETHVGGSGTRRSTLSPLGKQLVADFVELRAHIRRFTDSHFAARKTPR